MDEFVKKAGFKSLGEFKDIDDNKSGKIQTITFVIFTVLAILVMGISMGHMIGLPALSIISITENPVNYAITLCGLAVVFLIYGYDILKNGLLNLIHKSLSRVMRLSLQFFH